MIKSLLFSNIKSIVQITEKQATKNCEVRVLILLEKHLLLKQNRKISMNVTLMLEVGASGYSQELALLLMTLTLMLFLRTGTGGFWKK